MRPVCRPLAFVCLLTAFVPTYAQEKSYAEEYQNRIKSASNVQSVGDTPFGESIDLYTGATSFEQTDLVLEGIGPEIRISRRSNDSDSSTENPLQFSGFGDWELQVPYIQTLVPGTLTYGSTVGEWKTAGPSGATTDRCTNFGEMWTPPDNYYGPGSITAPAYSWWSGYTLKIPGVGSQPLLGRLSPAPTPSAGTYPGVTTQHWQIGCQAGLGTSNGEPGQGFVVLSPSGTKYFMTHLSYASYSTFRETFPEDPRIIARVGRNIARMKASRVEDRFGNYITYNYTGDKLTSITASDGRVVTLQWWPDAPLIQSITANGRTWTYSYASRNSYGGTLSQITQPDGAGWSFTGAAGPSSNLPVSFAGCLEAGDIPLPGSSAGIDRVYTIVHPSGAVGTFSFSNRLRAQSYAATLCEMTPTGGHETSNPYFLVNSLVQRQLSGPGLPNLVWSYTYEPQHVSANRNCPNNSCQSTTYTDVVEPAGHRTRYLHSTRYGALQGKLLSVARYSGAQLVRSESKSYNYAESDMPSSNPFGDAFSMLDPDFGAINLIALRKSVVTQDGRIFTWEVPTGCVGGLTGYCLDAFGRPTKTVKSSANQ